jgi:hypothetical protein
MREALEKLRGVGKRDAAISRAVLMPATKALTRVAEEQAPRRHEFATRR